MLMEAGEVRQQKVKKLNLHFILLLNRKSKSKIKIDMKAVCWYGANQVRWKRCQIKILNPRDAILKVTSTAICGSIYGGYIPTMQQGDIIGHEFMGEIVEVGNGVNNLKVGDRVVVPSTIGCGRCYYCKGICGRFAITRTLTVGLKKSCTAASHRQSTATRTYWAVMQALKEEYVRVPLRMSALSKFPKTCRTKSCCSFPMLSPPLYGCRVLRYSTRRYCSRLGLQCCRTICDDQRLYDGCRARDCD